MLFNFIQLETSLVFFYNSTHISLSLLSFLFQEVVSEAWRRTMTLEQCRSQQHRTDELCLYLAVWRSALFFLLFYIFNGIKNVNIWTFSKGKGPGRDGGGTHVWDMEFWWDWANLIIFFFLSWMHWWEIFCSFIVFKAFCICSGTVLQ